MHFSFCVYGALEEALLRRKFVSVDEVKKKSARLPSDPIGKTLFSWNQQINGSFYQIQ